MLGLGGGLFTFAALFYFAAEYEHLTGWKWALASLAVTLTIDQLFPASFIFVLPAQFGLFLVMWWAHIKNRVQRQNELDQRQKDDQRLRREHVREQQVAADAKTDWDAQEREREAADAAALKERQERVRLAREARDREEKERGTGGTGRT
jgi:signal transduction histidine kinase